ncbi:MAG: PGF-CTERM sorting domain-containing protein, partial [Methanothrix sp.]|uniref:PGF-CTERM sorting domain-containing protein n=1 Tax=Methanothrix sp. TaxID=90426 RepID=UPI003D2A54A1
NAITLNKNKDIALMAGIHVKTADQDVIDADNPLRFYIYKEATIEGAAPAPVVEEVAPTNVTEEKPVVEEKKVEEVAPTNVTEEKPAAEAEAKPAAEKGAPGFEAVFAVTGLLAVAYLVSRRN